ncbi:unnamed protein product [Spodoptera exigua]|nr:unnamed protein product [Spodoptera exigua]
MLAAGGPDIQVMGGMSGWAEGAHSVAYDEVRAVAAAGGGGAADGAARARRRQRALVQPQRLRARHMYSLRHRLRPSIRINLQRFHKHTYTPAHAKRRIIITKVR